jgi:hypothetical protein
MSEPNAASPSSICVTSAGTLSNFQVATFTHANGVEPTSAFTATINWGDGTTSAGTITLSGTTYVVKGSHTYAKSVTHIITTSVTEVPDSTMAKVEGISEGAATPKTDRRSDRSYLEEVLNLTRPLSQAVAQNDDRFAVILAKQQEFAARVETLHSIHVFNLWRSLSGIRSDTKSGVAQQFVDRLGLSQQAQVVNYPRPGRTENLGDDGKEN